jgi:hypothetical protein
MEFRYDIWRVDVAMYHPGVVANVIALLFDQVLQAVPAHARVKYGLYLVFLFAFYQDRRGRGFRTSANDRVGGSQSELDNREDWVQSVAMSVASTHTESPGCSTGAGSRRRL